MRRRLGKLTRVCVVIEVAFLFVTLTVGSSAVFARPFEVRDYFSVHRVAELAVSSDGRLLAYVVESPSLDENRVVRQVFVQSITGREARPVEVAELADAYGIAWIPGTSELAFLADRVGARQVFSYNCVTGKTKQWTAASVPIEKFRFSPFGDTLAFTTRAAPEYSDSVFRRLQDSARAVVINVDKFSAEDLLRPIVDKPSAQLWWSRGIASALRIPVAGDIAEFLWAPSAEALSITYISSDVPSTLLRSERTSVGVFDLKRSRFTVLAAGVTTAHGEPTVDFSGGEWLPDSKRVFLRKIMEKDPLLSWHYPQWTIAAVAGSLLDRGEWHETEVLSTATFFPIDGFTVYSENTVRGKTSLYTLGLSALTETPITSGLEGTNSMFRFSADLRTVAFINETLFRGPEVFVWRKGEAARKVTRLDTLGHDVTMPEARELHWASADGTTVDGWVLLPPGPVPQQGWPLITYVHGGPCSAVGNAFAQQMRYWPHPLEVYAAHGMAVLAPNYRGTCSFGRKFESPSGLDREPIDDVMSGVHYLVSTGVADPERLGIAGHSHGAWLGSLIMARAHIFKAGSFAEGWGNMLTLYTLMSGDRDREVYDRIYSSSMYESLQPYLALSPELHFEGTPTATLFEAGAERGAVYMMGYPKALRRSRAPTEFVVYPKTEHNLLIPRLVAESAQRNLDWFAYWLKDEQRVDVADPEQYARWNGLRAESKFPPDRE
jgi:dipeptidyl aminopeptidase/acylaminoacyl peptidase